MRKKTRKYFWIHSDGTVEEISKDQYLDIVIKQKDWAATKLVVAIYDGEINFVKGHNHIFLKKEWLDQILSS